MIKHNQSIQTVDTVPISHGVTHLAQHSVRGNPRDSDQLEKPQSRQTTFVSDDQIDGQKPLQQGQIGEMKEGTSLIRSLASLVIALIRLARSYSVALIVLTAGMGPALLFQGFGAIFLCIKPRLLLQQFHYFCYHLRILFQPHELYGVKQWMVRKVMICVI